MRQEVESTLAILVILVGLVSLAWMGDNEKVEAEKYRKKCDAMVAEGTWPGHKCK